MSDYHIPQPCHESWEAMTPAARGRHCASCDQVVVDLTACSGSEARALLARAVPQADGSTGLCARVRVDQRRRLVLGRFRRHVLTNGLAMLLASGALLGCDVPVVTGSPQPVDPQPVQVDPQPRDEHPALMGDVTIMGEMVAPRPVDPAPVQPSQPVLMGRIAQPQPEPMMGEISADVRPQQGQPAD